MRRLTLIIVVVLAVAAALSAQNVTARSDKIMISHGKLNFILDVTQDAFYIGEPAISVPAEALPGVGLRASRFSVRGWHEGDHVRVVVSAVVPQTQGSSKTIETAIATYALKFGSSGTARVVEMADWGATSMVLRSVRLLRNLRR